MTSGLFRHARTTATLAAALLLLCVGMSGVYAQQTPTPEATPVMPATLATNAPQEGLILTVYNQGTALVIDQRTLTLQPGVNRVDVTDVAASIDPTSVVFTSLDDPQGTVVLEQTYAYDLVDSNALLRRYVDQAVRLTLEDGSTVEGVLLTGGGGDLILRRADGSVVMLARARVVEVRFPDLPDGLITRPTLRWTLESQTEGPQRVQLAYLTGGMSWTADYNLLLRDDNALDLVGWVTLTNSSGTSFPDATVKLVAGDVNRVQPEMFMAMADAAMPLAAAPQERGATQREIFEYQLYALNRRVTVGNNEVRQVEFISAAGVPAGTYYVYDGSPAFYGYGGPIYDSGYGLTGNTTVQTFLTFSTDADGGLGADLPAGRVRVFQQDADGAAVLVGENRISHTPQGETVDLYLGNAFDLVGERRRTAFDNRGTTLTETFEVRLRNRKDDTPVQVRVPETLSRWSNWEIVESSVPYTQQDASRIEFRVDVPPGGETVLTYTVRYTFPR